jgi:hypothetical protein
VTDDEADDTPPIREGFADALRESAFGRVAPGETPSAKDLLAAMGGVRGLVESILPGLSFLIVYTITGQLLPSVLIPFAIAVAFVVARVVTRSAYTFALIGVLGIGLSAGLALFTGNAKDNFVLGFGLNALFIVILTMSILWRRPLVGVIAALIRGDDATWRDDRARFRVALIATSLWTGVFLLRLVVELPLYFAGATATLATLKLILGVPLYAIMLWVTWLLLRTAYARPEPE